MSLFPGNVKFRMNSFQGISDNESMWKIVDRIKNGVIPLPDLKFKIVGYEVEYTEKSLSWILVIAPTEDLKLDDLVYNK